MENYIVSARKYRPQAFEEVVGQSHVTNTLHKAIESNHLAQALLFTGPRGVGKTTSARILARMINSDAETTADQDFSFNIFELDAASNNSVDDIRNLIDQVRFAPQVGRYKVYIIDEVHMLSQQAFNAFLKTLEEPPKHAIFILATTEKHKIIPTILSRCQIYDFKRISVEDIAAHLQNVAAKEGVTADDSALRIIAQKADGALRDALSIFDRIVSFSGEHVSYQDVIENLRILDYDYYFRTIDLVRAGNQAGLLNLFNEILENGFDGHLYINGLASHCRDLLVCQDPATFSLLEVGAEVQQRYQQQAQEVNSRFLLAALKVLAEADVRYKNSNNSRLLVELALMDIMQIWHKAEAHTAAGGEKKKPDLSSQAVPRPEPAPSKPIEVQKAAPAPDMPVPQSEEPSRPLDNKIASPPSDPAPETPKAIVNPEPSTPEPAPARPNKLQKKRGSSFSISQALKGEGPDQQQNEEEEEEDLDRPVDGKPQQAFNQEQLQQVWNAFVEKVRAEGQKVVVATLAEKELKIKDNFEVEVTLDNNIQAQKFQEIKRDLLYHCREKLQNFGLFFSLRIEKGSQKLDPYSAPEKYQYLLEKNPHLAKLREDLGLDIE
ncbi:DNA polymerase III subunit gamma/tau [Croceimicrobium hydrocarbonivorans]|uniref:DNA polymerase III subunit gamma/tau n=1 Tax=Croceimicrobium hydrocarbonivorans TaxID=2761580 RepID=A0A7H0VG68_9FLAO|nr:DNA polymerase III subunit gamma/tau [Croceimicrobium hydrocarbonivorans]QNR24716.1 DNA polymerase III subunit gamma/tau [Croceimicrobium hydrocarbonivorans]